MVRNSRLEEFEIEMKPSRKTTKQTFYDFLYNEDTGAFLGRTASSWGESIIKTFSKDSMCKNTFLNFH